MAEEDHLLAHALCSLCSLHIQLLESLESSSRRRRQDLGYDDDQELMNDLDAFPKSSPEMTRRAWLDWP